MKILILVLLFTVSSFSAYSQGRSSKIYSDAFKRDKNMERIGSALTVIGGVSLFVGNILYWKVYHDNGRTSSGNVSAYRDVMIGGLGLMVIGIPIWSYGKANERHIRIDAQLVRFKGLIYANSIGFKMRF